MGNREPCQFRALYQVAGAINSELDPREVQKAIARSVATALGAKGCAIMLLSPDRRELRHAAAFGLSPRYMLKGPVRVDLSMSEALKGRSVAARDAGNDPRCQYGPQAIEEGIASILSVPLRLRDEVVGVVRVYTAQPREFTAEEIEFVEAAANLGAIAMENAHNHQEVREQRDMLSRYVYGDAWVPQLGLVS